MERVRGSIYYCSKRRSLVYRNEAPTSNYWDGLWRARRDADLVVPLPKKGTFITQETRKRLPEGARVLEGGCGTGIHARYLAESGFNVTALDWAAETVAWLQQHIPSIQPVLADLRKIPVDDAYFDGYWSLGVIEHFYEGYDEIAAEMARVIRPGGYLFLTFPHMSPARSVAVKLGRFPVWHEELRDNFYQFALRSPSVVRHFSSEFEMVSQRQMLGVSGFGDLFPAFEPLFDRLRRERVIGRRMVAVFDRLLSPFFGHVNLLVLRRK